MALVHSLDLRLLSSLCKNLTDYLQKKVYGLLYWLSVAHKATGFWMGIVFLNVGICAADRHRENRPAASDWVTMRVEGTCNRHVKDYNSSKFELGSQKLIF
jgi:hypothetical protein